MACARHDLPALDPATAGAARARQPRSAVRVRAGDRRRQPSGRDRRHARTRSTRSTKARRCSPARDTWCVNADPSRGFAPRLGRAFPTTCGRARSCSTSARRTTRPAAWSTLAEWQRLFDAVRPPRLRDRRRRMLFGDLLRRGATRRSARSRPRSASGRSDYPPPRRVRQPVEALECARPALGLRRRRRGAAQAVPALPHLSRLGDVAGRRRGEHRRVERRGARAREPAQVRAKFAALQPRARGGAAVRDAGRRVLPVGAHAGRRRRVRASASTPRRTSRCCRAATSRATRTARIPGATASASRSSPTRAECAEAVERIVAFARGADARAGGRRLERRAPRRPRHALS